MPLPNLYLNFHFPFSSPWWKNKIPSHLVLFCSMQIKEDKFFYHFDVATPSLLPKEMVFFPSENQSQTPVLLQTSWTHETTGQVGSILRGARRPRQWFWSWHSGLFLGAGHNNLSHFKPDPVLSFRPKLHQHRIIFMGAERYIQTRSFQSIWGGPTSQPDYLPFQMEHFYQLYAFMQQVFHSTIYWEADFVPDLIWVTCISLSKPCLTDKNAWSRSSPGFNIYMTHWDMKERKWSRSVMSDSLRPHGL